MFKLIVMALIIGGGYYFFTGQIKTENGQIVINSDYIKKDLATKSQQLQEVYNENNK